MSKSVESIASCALLLGTLFLEKPSFPHTQQALSGLADMDLEAEWPYGSGEELQSISQSMAIVHEQDITKIDRDYHHLFVGPQKLDAPPWGSVYLDSESVVFGDSCLALTRWMWTQGIEIHEGDSREPVDHIGRMLVLLSWLADNRPELVGEFLQTHLLTWAPTYLEKLKAAAGESVYGCLAELTAVTLNDIAA